MYNRAKSKDDAEILPGLADGEVAWLMIGGQKVTWEGTLILPGSEEESSAHREALKRDIRAREINNKS